MSEVYYIERTSSGTTGMSLDSKLYEKRIVYLDGAVNEEKVHELIKAITILEDEGDERITIVIDSPGGSIQAGLALIDVIKGCSCEVRTITLGIAASMAALIAAAGTKGSRFVSKHSRFMIHEPLLQNGVAGSCSTIQATAKSIMERKQLITDLLAEYTGNDVSQIEEATNFDNYMSSEESVEFGLADKIVSGKNLISILKGEEECF